MESRKEITDFVTTKKTEESGIYKIVKETISESVALEKKKIPVATFCHELMEVAEYYGSEYDIKKEQRFPGYVLKCTKTGERLTINPFADHGDVCPKLRGIIDLINADKEFPHFAVIVNNEIVIDDVLTGREYADRLASRASQLVLRIAILSEKCPLEDKPEEVDEEKAEA